MWSYSEWDFQACLEISNKSRLLKLQLFCFGTPEEHFFFPQESHNFLKTRLFLCDFSSIMKKIEPYRSIFRLLCILCDLINKKKKKEIEEDCFNFKFIKIERKRTFTLAGVSVALKVSGYTWKSRSEKIPEVHLGEEEEMFMCGIG